MFELSSRPRVFGIRAVVLAWFMTLVAAQSSLSFAYPPDDKSISSSAMTFNILDSVVLSWTSNYAQAWLWTYCNTSLGGGIERSTSNHSLFFRLLIYVISTVNHPNVPVSGTTIFAFPALNQLASHLDWSSPVACHFDLNYLDVNEKGLNGPTVLVTSIADKMEATTFSLSGTTTGNTIMLTQPFSNRLSQPSSAMPSQTSSSTLGSKSPGVSGSDQKSSFSNTAIVEIVVSAIVGLAIVIGLVFLLLRNHRKMKEIELKMLDQHRELHEAREFRYLQTVQPSPPEELDSVKPPQELYAGPVTRRSLDKSPTSYA